MSARSLRLARPLLVFDLETTGTSVADDRIVELAVVRLLPDGSRQSRAWRMNPGMPIPPAATAVHGLCDADVAGCPRFAELAEELAAVFEGCDLAGFNCERFDIPLLRAEFARTGRSFPAPDVAVVDAFGIFVKREPRDLGAAVRTFLGREHVGAHGAAADAEATADVLAAQLQRYADLPLTVPELHAALRDERYVDPDRKLRWQDDEAVFAFGKHDGRPLRMVAREHPDYLEFILSKDFPPALREIVREAQLGRFPRRAVSGT